jgi:hypothetical protein
VQPVASAGEARPRKWAEAPKRWWLTWTAAWWPRAPGSRELVLERSGAGPGGGLRVNNRMQATAGPLVVTARAVRRRA